MNYIVVHSKLTGDWRLLKSFATHDELVLKTESREELELKMSCMGFMLKDKREWPLADEWIAGEIT